VRQALNMLIHDGLLESRKGIGTFCISGRGVPGGELALVCYFAASYIFPGIVNAFERTAARNGFHMIFHQSEGDPEKERSILRKLKEKGVGGIAIVPIFAGADGSGAGNNYELLGEIMDGGTRVVLIDVNFGDERFPSILLDDRAVGATAARYLYERGHRDIGIVYARNHRPFNLRREGFAAALSSWGLEPSAASVGAERSSDLEEALYEALGTKVPSAYFCANDEIAVALYKAAARRGISIPGELSVISVDNSDYAELPGMDLTSISHPSSFIGGKAAQILIDGMTNPELRFREAAVIEPSVVERGSVRSTLR
jgi:GntR family transcriptional regulator, arabinose operon transcriptional repressor